MGGNLNFTIQNSMFDIRYSSFSPPPPHQSDLSNRSNLSETFDNISDQFPKKYLTNRLNPDTLNLTDAVLN